MLSRYVTVRRQFARLLSTGKLLIAREIVASVSEAATATALRFLSMMIVRPDPRLPPNVVALVTEHISISRVYPVTPQQASLLSFLKQRLRPTEGAHKRSDLQVVAAGAIPRKEGVPLAGRPLNPRKVLANLLII
jgi:hypothetical protein